MTTTIKKHKNGYSRLLAEHEAVQDAYAEYRYIADMAIKLAHSKNRSMQEKLESQDAYIEDLCRDLQDYAAALNRMTVEIGELKSKISAARPVNVVQTDHASKQSFFNIFNPFKW